MRTDHWCGNITPQQQVTWRDRKAVQNKGRYHARLC
jgi:hypothetical protein